MTLLGDPGAKKDEEGQLSSAQSQMICRFCNLARLYLLLPPYFPLSLPLELFLQEKGR